MTQTTKQQSSASESPSPEKKVWKKQEMWKLDVKDIWLRSKIAIGLHKDMESTKNNSLVRRLVKKTQDGTLGQPTDDPYIPDKDDDVAIHIGDTHVHEAPTVPRPKKSAATLGKMALIAAGLVGLGGAGAVATHLLLKDNDDKPVKQPVVDDQDTLLYWEIVDPDETIEDE